MYPVITSRRRHCDGEKMASDEGDFFSCSETEDASPGRQKRRPEHASPRTPVRGSPNPRHAQASGGKPSPVKTSQSSQGGGWKGGTAAVPLLMRRAGVGGLGSSTRIAGNYEDAEAGSIISAPGTIKASDDAAGLTSMVKSAGSPGWLVSPLDGAVLKDSSTSGAIGRVDLFEDAHNVDNDAAPPSPHKSAGRRADFDANNLGSGENNYANLVSLGLHSRGNGEIQRLASSKAGEESDRGGGGGGVWSDEGAEANGGDEIGEEREWANGRGGEDAQGRMGGGGMHDHQHGQRQHPHWSRGRFGSNDGSERSSVSSAFSSTTTGSTQTSGGGMSVHRGRNGMTSKMTWNEDSGLERVEPMLLERMREVAGAGSCGGKDGWGHTGPIWVAKFSLDYTLLATGGADGKLLLWTVEAADDGGGGRGVGVGGADGGGGGGGRGGGGGGVGGGGGGGMKLGDHPVRTWDGHDGEVLDISLSSQGLVLSSGTDWLVKLWHPDSALCLRTFEHSHIATSVVFHPENEQLFFTGCLDGKVRLFDLRPRSVEEEGKAISEINTKGFVTAMAVSNDGKTVAAGLFEGKCMLFQFAAERRKLENHHKTIMNVKSTRGRNSKGHKITGLQYVGGDKNDPEAKLLVTTLDSRVRLYRVTTLSLICKYKGHVNEGSVLRDRESVSTQIRGVLSPDMNFVACGSEDGSLYVWSKTAPRKGGIFASSRRDRNSSPYQLQLLTAQDKSSHGGIGVGGGGLGDRDTPTAVAFCKSVANGEGGLELCWVVGMFSGELRVVRATGALKGGGGGKK